MQQGTDLPLIDTSVAGISEAAVWRAYNVTISKKSIRKLRREYLSVALRPKIIDAAFDRLF